MAKQLFYTSIMIFLLQTAYILTIKREIFSLNSFVFCGVFIPCVLYLMKWSSFIIDEPCAQFYYIISTFFLLLSILRIFCNKQREIKLLICVTKYFKYLDLLNVFFMLIFFIESLLLSGHFMPALVGIDIHTTGFPLISMVTHSMYPMAFCDLLGYIVTKKKRYLSYFFCYIICPVICRGSRMVAVMISVQCFSFYLAYLTGVIQINNFNSSILKYSSIKNKVIITILIAVLVLFLMVQYTQYRMKQFNNSNSQSYASLIRYTGPNTNKTLTKILAIYYGYFPMSFENLNYTVMYEPIHHNYIGLYSFVSVYYGLFHIHKFLPLDPYEPVEHKLYHTGAATVCTGFYEYYYDFGLFCFIPILIFLIICIYYRNKMYSKQRLKYIAMYFYLIPLLIFLSFQNILYSANMIWEILLLHCILRLFYIDKKEADKVNENNSYRR